MNNYFGSNNKTQHQSCLSMKKIKQEKEIKTPNKGSGHIVKNQRYRDRQAQKTIQQLKESIGSIEKMIQKSQQILRNTRPLKPRQVRSDSLELRLNFNNSKSKCKKKDHIINQDSKKHLNEISTTAVTRNTTKAVTPLSNQFNSFRQASSKQSNLPYFPQKNKPYKPYLFIDTENLDTSIDDKPRARQNIYINDTRSPVSAVNYQRQTLEQSFAESLENAFSYGRRIKTQALNESIDRSSLQQSAQRGSIQNLDERTKQQRQMKLKKIVLKRNTKNNNLNLNHMKTYSELEESLKSPKRQFIYEMQRSPQKGKQGKYSYGTKSKPLLNERATKNQLKKDSKVEPKVFNYASNPRMEQDCLKFNKQNSSTEVDDFYKKVKKFGFVERYLNYSEIGCIYQYLKKSEIPQHKWPLYVVDKVYQKMQGLSRLKI